VDGGRRRLRRGGYLTCDAAVAARDKLSVPQPGDPGGHVLTMAEWRDLGGDAGAAAGQHAADLPTLDVGDVRDRTLRAFQPVHTRLWTLPSPGLVVGDELDDPEVA
jgi:hypothetical protein